MPSRALHNEHFHLVSTVLNVAYIVENQRFTSENLLGQPAKLTKLLTVDIWTIWETIDSRSVSLLERFFDRLDATPAITRRDTRRTHLCPLATFASNAAKPA